MNSATNNEEDAWIDCSVCDGQHTREEGGCLAPRKAYSIVSEAGESGYSVAIFSRSEVEARYGAATDDRAEELCARLTGWARSYNGPGRGFRADPFIRIYKRNIIIRQFAGLDI